MNTKPLVSIIIPVYNGSNYMKEAIDSAINQTYDNCEIIVINDGSTDNGETTKIAKSYGNKIVYYEKENGGVSTALNFGIKHMHGEFFSWLSHDDRYYPNKISYQMEYLIDHNLLKERVITYSNYDVIDENSRITNVMKFEKYEPNKHQEYSILHGLISGTSLLIPKKAFDEIGLFEEKYRCIQDYLLFFNFLKKYRYIFLTEVTNSTRVHSKQVTNMNSKVIEENNFLWIYMQKELPDERKINLAGSKYKFFVGMYNYLKSITNYQEAIDYSKMEYTKELKNNYELLSKNKNNESTFSTILISFEKLFPLYKSKVKYTHSIDKNIEKCINEIGLKKVIEYMTIHCSNTRKLKEYVFINKNIKEDDNGNTIISGGVLFRLKRRVKEDGLYGALVLFKNKFFGLIYRIPVIKNVAKLFHYLRKIMLFLPKVLLEFVLNS